jgi:hypothetical protein
MIFENNQKGIGEESHDDDQEVDGQEHQDRLLPEHAGVRSELKEKM